MRIVIDLPDHGRYPRAELLRRLEWEANAFHDTAELAVQVDADA